ncbi:sulfurtransferase [Novosphingobium sp. PASSN1]|uniref:sulfurtransferase n=1 Tax=Novosphingobium sp. PASSN1 TaxID=2015561 RepID=UPI000BD7C9C0|nr:sulfurtransferase [Novosphingobium sp. PASSN1]OYU36128.1 MAG: 3-mercaptopyruvate sulfurtransferase [Novosphingobium sp. PASSN1]
MDSLVSTQWLASELGASDLRIVDATAFLPEYGRDPVLEYEACHIPGAVFMNLAELADPAQPGLNMLPSPERFASKMQSLGLGDGSRIVLYDDSPVKTSARAWFMLTMFGAANVALLDGGIAKWKAEGRKCAQGKETLRHRHFTVWSDDRQVRSKADVLDNLASHAALVVDARGPGRFTGDVAEVKPGLASGHIPGARNVYYANLFRPDGTWKSPADIRAVFEAAGVDLARPLITSCGSGVTASALLFGLHLIGKEDTALYDGSWSEWGADPETPKETGAAR